MADLQEDWTSQASSQTVRLSSFIYELSKNCIKPNAGNDEKDSLAPGHVTLVEVRGKILESTGSLTTSEPAHFPTGLPAITGSPTRTLEVPRVSK